MRFSKFYCPTSCPVYSQPPLEDDGEVETGIKFNAYFPFLIKIIDRSKWIYFKFSCEKSVLLSFLLASVFYWRRECYCHLVECSCFLAWFSMTANPRGSGNLWWTWINLATFCGGGLKIFHQNIAWTLWQSSGNERGLTIWRPKNFHFFEDGRILSFLRYEF